MTIIFSITLILIILIIWTIISWLIIRNIEKPKYDVVSKNKIYEIRNYKSYIIAETQVTGKYQDAMEKGFRKIADYIFGNNTSSEKIAMTAPVGDSLNKNNQSEKIAMTSPVIEKGNESMRNISFIMPSKYTLENIPKPNNDQVILREIPARKMAVLKYTWYTNEKRIKEKTDILLKQLQLDNIEILGQAYSARYNPPFSMPLILRNEIMVEVS